MLFYGRPDRSKANVSSDQVRVIEERGTSRLMKFLDKVVDTSFVERLISDKYGYVDDKIYVDIVRNIIQKLYEEGNVVIIGRGSQYILKELSNIIIAWANYVRGRGVFQTYSAQPGRSDRRITNALLKRHLGRNSPTHQLFISSKGR